MDKLAAITEKLMNRYDNDPDASSDEELTSLKKDFAENSSDRSRRDICLSHFASLAPGKTPVVSVQTS